MNLNNTLRKVFEKDKNGDVTIETALETIGEWILFVLLGIVILGLFAVYLFGMWYAYSDEFYQNMSEPVLSPDRMIYSMLSVTSLLLTICVCGTILSKAYESIKHTKLAKCPVNKDDNNKLE